MERHCKNHKEDIKYEITFLKNDKNIRLHVSRNDELTWTG